jgi:hypothetical protein
VTALGIQLILKSLNCVLKVVVRSRSNVLSVSLLFGVISADLGLEEVDDSISSPLLQESG